VASLTATGEVKRNTEGPRAFLQSWAWTAMREPRSLLREDILCVPPADHNAIPQALETPNNGLKQSIVGKGSPNYSRTMHLGLMTDWHGNPAVMESTPAKAAQEPPLLQRSNYRSCIPPQRRVGSITYMRSRQPDRRRRPTPSSPRRHGQRP